MKYAAWIAVWVSTVLASSCSKEYGYVFEHGFNSGEYEDTVTVNIDTNRFKIDYSKYTQARVFPGLMDAEEPRLEDFLVQVDLNYEEIRSADLRISIAPGNWQSTGVYAPAGELIVIDVPAGVYGLSAQIGAHVANSDQGIDFPRRDLNVVEYQTLFPGKNYMRNLYGGLVYIRPTRPLGRIIDIRFSGVAKAPSFKLGETTNEEWHEMVEKTTVPWFELEGRRIVFTLETSKLKKFPIEDPTALMETWDEMIRQGYWDWTGMTEGNPDIRHRAPFNKWRIVHDVLFRPGVAQVSGYPVRAGNTDNYFRQATDIEAVKFSNWGTYHELGHNMQMGSTWNFNGNGEVTCNLFSFKVSMLNGRQSYKIAEVWNKAVPYIAAAKSREIGADKVNWASMDVSGNPYQSAAHDIRLMMYAQIFEKYGYDFMTYIYKRGREARFTSANDQSKIDFFYEALSEFTGIDMEPYLNIGWGLYPSTVSKRYVSETLRLPILEREVWKFNPVTKTGGDDIYLPLLDKTEWTITTNSEDLRSNSLRPVTNLIDNNPTSVWHTCFSNNCANVSRYEIDIDMKQVNSISGFTLLQRHDGIGNHVKKITVEIKENQNDAYSLLGTYDLAFGNEAVGKDQVVRFNTNGVPVPSRYIRFIISKDDINGDSNYNAALNELGLFN